MEAERSDGNDPDLPATLREEVTLFDLYQEPPIPEGKKGSLIESDTRQRIEPLTDEEVNQYHEKILSRLKEIFQLDLRQ